MNDDLAQLEAEMDNEQADEDDLLVRCDIAFDFESLLDMLARGETCVSVSLDDSPAVDDKSIKTVCIALLKNAQVQAISIPGLKASDVGRSVAWRCGGWLTLKAQDWHCSWRHVRSFLGWRA